MVVMLPWGIDISFTAVVFYGIGYLMKITKFIILKLRTSIKTIVFFSAIGSTLLFSQLNTIVFMYNNKYGNYFLFFIAAFSAIIACVILSNAIGKSSVLSYLGKNGLIILAVHPKVLEFLNLIIIKFLKVDIVNSVAWGCIYTILIILMIIPFIQIINEYFPFILGKTKIKEVQTITT